MSDLKEFIRGQPKCGILIGGAPIVTEMRKLLNLLAADTPHETVSFGKDAELHALRSGTR